MQAVVYLICFDLSASAQNQCGQITYWLDYLSSILDFPEEGNYWKVFLVGVKGDLASTGPFSDISTLQSTWRSIPLYEEIFVTSYKDGDSVQNLLSAVKKECAKIMMSSEMRRRVPKSYLAMLEFIQTQSNPLVNRNDIPDPEGIKGPVLRHFHSVGDIILLGDDLVCGRPSEISTIMAKFISPESIQANLPRIANSGIEILSLDQIGKILKVKDRSWYVKQILNLRINTH